VEVTLSRTGSGDLCELSVDGLSEEVLAALLAALEEVCGANQGVTLGTTKQSADSAHDAAGLESVSDNSAKFTVRLTLDSADPLKGMAEIASVIQALTEPLQKKALNIVELVPSQTATADLNASNPFAQLLAKETSADVAQATRGLTVAFSNLVSQSSTLTAQALTDGLEGTNGLNLIPTDASELKVPNESDLTEPLLSRIRVTFPLAGVVEAAGKATEEFAGDQSEGKGKSGFAEQGAPMQAGVQRQQPLAESSNRPSFGSIVADRLAAVAEQVGLREKPLDITLRLKMEGGESLLVGLKEQAGKIIIQVRCADGQVVNLLQSQKETIVRNLEAKQISSTISVGPIEEDLTRRQGREQQKNMWGRRREPANPYIETSI
jgi:hypothetical protein